MQPDGDGSGVTTAAKEQVGQVGRTAADAGGSVAQTTRDQAQNVVGEAKQQARDLVGEARLQVQDQAGMQKSRAVQGLRALGGELDEMAMQGGQSGLATEVARQAAQRAHYLADHLDRYEPTDLLEQVRSYARRRPVVFLAGAALAGVVAGRLTRNLASDNGSSGQHTLTGGYTEQTYATPTYTETAYSEPVPAGPGPAYAGTTYGTEPGYSEPGYAEPGYAAPAEPSYPGAGYEPSYPEPGYQEPGYPGPTGRTP